MLIASAVFLVALLGHARATTVTSAGQYLLDGVHKYTGPQAGQYRRVTTMASAMHMTHERGGKIWVETGTSRDGPRNCLGDGCSTLLFSYVRQQLHDPAIRLYSVDIDAEYCKTARQAISEYGDAAAEVVAMDSVEFLTNFTQITGHDRIDFLYLDSYDYKHHNWMPSQEHHLREIQAAMDKLHDNSVVLIDDCFLPFNGKCRLAGAFLERSGWTGFVSDYILQSMYQEIYVKKAPVIDSAAAPDSHDNTDL